LRPEVDAQCAFHSGITTGGADISWMKREMGSRRNFELATVMNRRVRWAEFDEGGRRDLSALGSSLAQKVDAFNNHFPLFEYGHFCGGRKCSRYEPRLKDPAALTAISGLVR
jgi:hypothetical protein